ncbi:MAG TPA: translation initiation factor IF-3 [Acidimicrobiales bacterium]|nr:translation initiation factor IF-3 [Acidimicrobiales bacterium]
MARRTPFPRRSESKHRINGEIRAERVRLIDETGEQVGEMPLPAALEASRRAGMDLVEVAPDARPPVARIMDHGKYAYEQSVKARAKKKRSGGGVKEMKYRPNIGDHDFLTKTRKVADFLTKGNKVKLTVWLRGRERSMPGLAEDVVERVVTEVDDMVDDDITVEAPVRGDGPQRSAVIATSAGD